MLKIEIVNFRCWKKLNLIIPTRKVTLIKGCSGSGKTSILKAILWCLYNKIQCIEPHSVEKKKLHISVTLSFPTVIAGIEGIMTIRRTKGPISFTVSHPAFHKNGQHIIYEDKVAQSIVNDVMGSYDIWMASCYIGQKIQNSFLISPNNGKLELLNSIAFHEEDPFIYIDKISTTALDADYKYKSQSKIFESNLEQLNCLLENTNMSAVLTPELRQQYQDYIKNLNIELTNLTGVHNTRLMNLNLIERLKQQISTLPDPKDIVIQVPTHLRYLFSDDMTIETIVSVVDEIDNAVPLLLRRDNLLRQLDTLQKGLQNAVTPIVLYDEKDYSNSKAQENIYHQNFSDARQLGVSLSQESINSKIAEYNNIIRAQNLLHMKAEFNYNYGISNEMRNKYVAQSVMIEIPEIIPIAIPPLDLSSYSTEKLQSEINNLSSEKGSIETHIKHLNKGYDVIRCPHCSGSVRYINSTLSVADTAPTNKEEIIQCKSKLKQIDAEIITKTREIQDLNKRSTLEKQKYDFLVAEEQKRLEKLRQAQHQIEMENQRRISSNVEVLTQIQLLDSKLMELDTKIKEIITSQPDIVDAPNTKILSPAEISNTHNIVAKLQNLKITELPEVSSETILNAMNQQKQLLQIESQKKNYEEHMSLIPEKYKNLRVDDMTKHNSELKNYVNGLKRQLLETEKIINKKVSLQQQMQAIESELVPDVSNKITELQNTIGVYVDALDMDKKANEAVNEYQRVSKEREVLMLVNEELSGYQQLRDHAIKTEHVILDKVVTTINNIISNVCHLLFDQDISINLSLFKELKTTGKAIPKVNFAISYKNGKYDDINGMSGGEADRVSLALTLALNRLSSSPFMFLDETLGSFDPELKISTISALKDFSDSTVVVVLHEGVEGIFDYVIDTSDSIGEMY